MTSQICKEDLTRCYHTFHFWEPPLGGDLGVQMYNVEMAGAIVNLANLEYCQYSTMASADK